jgi:hypothetical protein
MRKNKIVTHAGKAHRDEYLACCAIMFHAYREGKVSYVERRLAGDGDLRCKDTWVVDTGGEYSPYRRNFDHHQRDAPEGMCSLDMVLLEILGDQRYEAYRKFSPWLRLTAAHDNDGNQAAAQSLGLSNQSYYATRSPVEHCMLNAFAEVTVVHPESPLAANMREIGRFLLCEAEEITAGMEERLIASPAPFMHAGLRVWDVRSAWGSGSDSLTVAMVNQAASVRSVDLIVGRNNRTGGVSLYRTGWAGSKMDLSRLHEMEGISFAHKNGFYAIADSDVSVELLTAAITAASNMTSKNERETEAERGPGADQVAPGDA